jgi:hypothetical protein
MAAEFALNELTDAAPAATDLPGSRSARDLEAVYDIPVTVSAVLGKAGPWCRRRT